jgi:hypothetical protein
MNLLAEGNGFAISGPPRERLRISPEGDASGASIVGVMLRRVLSMLRRAGGQEEPVETKVVSVGIIPEHESAVRRMVADAHGDIYEAITSLDEARARADAVIVMEGDYGGSVYLTCPAHLVQCNEQTLRQLLHDLDEHDWKDAEGAGLYYEVAPVGSGVVGGSGGGLVTENVWLHPDLEAKGLREGVEAVITGKRLRLS